MGHKRILSSKEIKEFKISEDRKLFSAEHNEILEGLTNRCIFCKNLRDSRSNG
jgi:hypothetical protein